MKLFEQYITEEVNLKDRRNAIKTTMQISTNRLMNSMETRYSNDENITATRNDAYNSLDIDVINYVYSTIKFNLVSDLPELDGNECTVVFKTPNRTRFSVSIDPAKLKLDDKGDSRTLRNEAELVNCSINTEDIKMDKGTTNIILNLFKKAKLNGTPIKDCADKCKNIKLESILQYPRIKDDYDKMTRIFVRNQAKENSYDRPKAKEINKIAREYNVDSKQVVLGANVFVIMDGVFNIEVLQELVNSFDVYATKSITNDALENNNTIIEELKKISTGKLVYDNGHSNTITF